MQELTKSDGTLWLSSSPDDAQQKANQLNQQIAGGLAAQDRSIGMKMPEHRIEPTASNREFTDTERLEFLMRGMYRVDSRLHIDGKPGQQWNCTPFTIKAGAVQVENFMRDMRAVIDEAMSGPQYGVYETVQPEHGEQQHRSPSPGM